MTIETILNKLPKFRSQGGNKFRAPCPVHDGKDFNLLLSEDATGKVGAHCFVCGANGLAVVNALGLSSAELFPPDDHYQRPAVTTQMKNKKLEAQCFIDIYREESKKRPMTLEEKRGLKKAQALVAGVDSKIA